jgi:hypothetical protein
MITPDHKFELLKTAVIVVPAAVASLWALKQWRQTKPRLDVLLTLIHLPTLDGKSVLADEWPGIVARNQSSFPLRICNVGLCIGKKFFEFGRPLGSNLQETDWPYEIAPRARMDFYFNQKADYGGRFGNAIRQELSPGNVLWETVRAYAMTECAHTFISKRMSHKSRRMLRQAVKDRSKAFPLAGPNRIIE